MSTKQCFYIGPIGTPGDGNYEQAKGFYRTTVKPTLEKRGFSVIRADEVSDSGIITGDIVTRLADSDLVVAELGGLNANVLYELGIRHALVKRGTILIVDESRTTTLPFDLASTRSVFYKPSFDELEGFISKLDAAICWHLEAEGEELFDSLVHLHIPGLPSRLADFVNENSVSEDRRKAAALETRLRAYQQRFGDIGEDSAGWYAPADPLSLIDKYLSDPEALRSPSQMVGRAADAASNADADSFLRIVRDIASVRPMPIDPSDFQRLIFSAMRLGLSPLVESLERQAKAQYPDEPILRNGRLARHCQSSRSEERDAAVQEVFQVIELDPELQDVEGSPRWIDGTDLDLLGFALDALHADGDDARALEVVNYCLSVRPDDPELRCWRARTLGYLGDISAELSEYGELWTSPAAPPRSAMWAGNALHNEGRHIDAYECYLLACLLDVDDEAHFRRVILSGLRALTTAVGTSLGATRSLPENLTEDMFLRLFDATLSCSDVTQNTFVQLVRSASPAKGLGYSRLESRLTSLASAQAEIKYMTLTDRYVLASSLHSEIASSLTRNSAVVAASG